MTSKIIKASEIKAGFTFRYVGSFAWYTALSNAEPDPSYPGKVTVVTQRSCSPRIMNTRLWSDQAVTVM